MVVLLVFLWVLFAAVIVISTIAMIQNCMDNKEAPSTKELLPQYEWVYEETPEFKEWRIKVNTRESNDKGELCTTRFNDRGEDCMFFGCGLKGCTMVNKVEAGGFFESRAKFVSWAELEDNFSTLKSISPRRRRLKNEHSINTDELVRKAKLWDEANKELEAILTLPDLEELKA